MTNSKSNELDDRLKEIVNNLEGDWFDNERVVTEAIAQIKQAFAEYGTSLSEEIDKDVELMFKASEPRMTGQEFYDRFEDELMNDGWHLGPVLEAAKRAAGLNKKGSQ